MGHCDNPDCQHEGSLQRWETNELIVTINGVGALVRSYCNDCLAAFMARIHEHFPAPAPVTETTAKGETVVLSESVLQARATQP